MEQKIYKCSMTEHSEIDSISFCVECKIYMCNKCDKYHSELFKNHNQYKLNDYDITDIFTGLCTDENHFVDLQYFCQNHNKLCCAKCITKIKSKENGHHTDCNICLIEDIENTKKNKLKENIKCLDDLSINLDKTIKDIKIIYEKISIKKEELKKNVQIIFTKLRNCLNNREDELLLDIDKIYKDNFLDEDIIKLCEKLPNKINNSLKKGRKLIDDNWKKDNKLNKLINDCLEIEKNIEEINKINETIKKMKTNKEIKFLSNEDEINQICESIKKFGKIKKNYLFNSLIEIDEDLVKSWLNNRNFFAELLFRKSKDGSTPKDFHNKCDNKGITITFIETTKGYKFGGYTELEWDCSRKGKTDKSTFIFSLNKRKKFLAKNNNESINCYEVNGPRFGCTYTYYSDIYFYQTLNKGSCELSKDSTFLTENELTNGEKYWDVKEIEVYKIIYIK